MAGRRTGRPPSSRRWPRALRGRGLPRRRHVATLGLRPARARIDAISFRNAWDTALDYAVRRLFDAVFSRAINGVPVPKFYRGEQIGERRHYDERLAMFILRYRDPLRYGKWLDRQEYGGHAEGHAIELNEARAAIREDAALSIQQIPDRFAQRIRDALAKVRHFAEGGHSRGDAP